MARGLIVACGCRGRALGRELLDNGWQVRGTSRDDAGLAAIDAARFEPALADPDRAGTVVEQLEGVSVIFWLLGSASGAEDAVAALHGPRLERILEEIVDTPVRGFVYEGAGSVAAEHLERGAAAVRAANERWRIPIEITRRDPDDHDAWRAEALEAALRLTGVEAG